MLISNSHCKHRIVQGDGQCRPVKRTNFIDLFSFKRFDLIYDSSNGLLVFSYKTNAKHLFDLCKAHRPFSRLYLPHNFHFCSANDKLCMGQIDIPLLLMRPRSSLKLHSIVSGNINEFVAELRLPAHVQFIFRKPILWFSMLCALHGSLHHLVGFFRSV